MKSDGLYLSGVDIHQKKDTLISTGTIDLIFSFLGGAIYGNSKDQPKRSCSCGAFSLTKSPLVLIYRKYLFLDLTGVPYAILRRNIPNTFSFIALLHLNFGLFSPHLLRLIIVDWSLSP